MDNFKLWPLEGPVAFKATVLNATLEIETIQHKDELPLTGNLNSVIIYLGTLRDDLMCKSLDLTSIQTSVQSVMTLAQRCHEAPLEFCSDPTRPATLQYAYMWVTAKIEMLRHLNVQTTSKFEPGKRLLTKWHQLISDSDDYARESQRGFATADG